MESNNQQSIMNIKVWNEQRSFTFEMKSRTIYVGEDNNLCYDGKEQPRDSISTCAIK